MTTNAVGLDKKAAGLSRRAVPVNVSLDSLHEETFTQLTRRPFLNKVLAGVEAGWAAGLGPVKLNAVLMRGINDAEPPRCWPGRWTAATSCASSSKCRSTPTTAGPAGT